MLVAGSGEVILGNASAGASPASNALSHLVSTLGQSWRQDAVLEGSLLLPLWWFLEELKRKPPTTFRG